MTQNLLSPTQDRQLVTPTDRRPPRLRSDADAALREIAYVLQLTRRVRAEIVNDEPAPEVVHA